MTQFRLRSRWSIESFLSFLSQRSQDQTMVPCGAAYGYRRLERMYYLHLQGIKSLLAYNGSYQRFHTEECHNLKDQNIIGTDLYSPTKLGTC
jgi:hypothetical protein